MARPRTVEDAELLDAAMFAFWAKGYDGVSTRALEEVTGLPASSLYHRHGSKDGLFAAAIAHYNARVVGGRIARYLGDAQPDALAGLREFFTSVYRTGRHPYHACLLANTAAQPGPHADAVRRELAAGQRLLLAGFAAAVRRAIAQGRLRSGLDPDLTANYLLLGLRGLLATARSLRDPQKLDELVDLMLGGLSP
ncbi:MAG: TetR/AcrR family transcriptional regulator [Pseudomonadota bacterium]